MSKDKKRIGMYGETDRVKIGKKGDVILYLIHSDNHLGGRKLRTNNEIRTIIKVGKKLVKIGDYHENLLWN